MNTEKLTDENLRKAIRALKNQKAFDAPTHMYIPVPHWEINRETYKGTGRPRKIDYVWVDFIKDMKEILSSSPSTTTE